MWIRKEDAFIPIVAQDLFYTAQGIIRARARRFTNDELLDRLRVLYQNRGCLSGLIINETDSIARANNAACADSLAWGSATRFANCQSLTVLSQA